MKERILLGRDGVEQHGIQGVSASIWRAKGCLIEGKPPGAALAYSTSTLFLRMSK